MKIIEYRRFISFIVGITCFWMVKGQVSIQDSTINLTMLNVAYRSIFTGGDMADRFGYSHTVGFEVGHKFPNNFYIQGGVGILLGGTVREDSILNHLHASPGLLINNNGELTDVRFIQEGYMIPLSIGKIFPVFPNHNPNSGFYVELGGQFLQHKIQMRPNMGDIQALSKQNKRGYDRLTNGFGVREGFGYKYFGNSGYLNFSIGVDLSQNFTRNRRTLNVDTGIMDTKNRVDLLTGFHVSWIFLIYNKAPNTIYYN